MKLTRELLRKIVLEEKAKLEEADKTDLEKVKADEVDADELADSLEKPIDFVKALKIKESRLIHALRETRTKIARATRRK